MDKQLLSKNHKEIPWVISDQTKIKHCLLESYIEKWTAILFKHQEKIRKKEILIYFDGFSGPGIYWKDDYKKGKCFGSPLIVAKIAKKYLKDKANRRFIIICIDKDIRCVEILRNYLSKYKRYNKYWKAYHAEFNDKVNSILDDFESSGYNVPPIFFFIDPFGYSGFPMETLRRILNYPRCELFINFMVYDILRFCNNPEKTEGFRDLFSTDEFLKTRNLNSSNEKNIYLRNLYCRQLRSIAKAKYVMPFRVNTPEQGTRPKYFLIHASNHIKALKEMKNSMAKISDKTYSFEAIGIPKNQTNLFEDPEKISLRKQIKSFLITNYPNSMLYENIEEWAYANTNAIDKTLKITLREMEDEKLIEIDRKPGQIKTTVVNGAIINCIK